MALLVAHRFKLLPEHVLIASTGRIGVPMPMTQVERGVLLAVPLLGDSAEHAAHAAEAILTSDTRAKQIAVEFLLDGKRVRIGGICKGAGMIQPGTSATGARPAAIPLHATMLCFLTTDAAIAAPALQAALQEAVATSFNRITVDGDMSTNDTVLVLANGLAENEPIRPTRVKKSAATSRRQLQNLDEFQAALSYVCLELAKMIVRDGEGVSRFVTVRVSGAKSFADADAAARAVANSSLVKRAGAAAIQTGDGFSMPWVIRARRSWKKKSMSRTASPAAANSSTHSSAANPAASPSAPFAKSPPRRNLICTST